jgi:hypothetical protein
MDINPESRFFQHSQKFDTGMYKTPANFDYYLETILPNDGRFPAFNELLKVSGNHNFGYQYTSRIPVWVKIQKEYFKNRSLEVEFAEFLNNFIIVYEYFTNDYGIPPYVLDGRKVLKEKANGGWSEVPYNSLNEVNFFDVLRQTIMDGEGSTDLISSVSADKVPFDLEWKIFLTGIKFFYQGNFKQVIINCLTAIEAQITGPLNSWLLSVSSSSADSIKKILFDFSNPLKFDIYINTIFPGPFKKYKANEMKTIIDNFKGINTIRNKIVHQGFEPQMADARTAIEMTGLFLRDVWLCRENYKLSPK